MNFYDYLSMTQRMESTDVLSEPVGDYRLSKVALEAANQIDELLNGRSFDIRPALELASMITDSFSLDEDPGSKSFVDSGTVAMFLRTTEKPPEKLEDMISRAEKIVCDLKAAEFQSGEKVLCELRNFCLALSAAAISYSEGNQSDQEFVPV